MTNVSLIRRFLLTVLAPVLLLQFIGLCLNLWFTDSSESFDFRVMSVLASPIWTGYLAAKLGLKKIEASGAAIFVSVLSLYSMALADQSASWAPLWALGLMCWQAVVALFVHRLVVEDKSVGLSSAA